SADGKGLDRVQSCRRPRREAHQPAQEGARVQDPTRRRTVSQGRPGPSNWWPKGQLRGDGPIDAVDLPGRNPALLAIHGFGATPNEVLMLTEEARALRLRTRAPLLPGHGTHAGDLARTSYADWYASAERELLQLSESDSVIVGGQSMGAVVALDLAATHPSRVRALVV